MSHRITSAISAFVAVVAFAALLAPAAASAQASPSPYTSATRFDAMRRVAGTISPDPDTVGSGNPFLAVRNTYDVSGWLWKVETGTLSAWHSEAVAPAAWTGFIVEQTLETTYDSMGRKLRDTVRDGSGAILTVTQYSYDSFGRLECTAIRMNPAAFASLPTSACNHSTYDPLLGRDRISRNAYDPAGQRLQLREGVGTTDEAAEATWAYNLNGQVTTVIDANGNRAELRYDGHSRQDRWTFPSTTRPSAYNDATQATALASAGSVNAADHEQYGYDAGGNRTSLKKRDGSTLSYQYDALNRMTSKTVPISATGAAGYVVNYVYDLRGLQTEAHFGSSGGLGIWNHYDGFGRLRRFQENRATGQLNLYYEYDNNGRRTRLMFPDGQYFNYDHDGLSRLTAIRENGSATIATFAYDSAGRPQSLTRGGGAVTAWDYDGIGRLDTLSHDLAGTAQDVGWTFTHNAASQLLANSRSNDAYAWTGHYVVSRNYTTNGLNQYSAAGLASLHYDDNGNLDSESSTSYVYDAENRLVSASGARTAQLSYDPLGRLTQTWSPATGATQFLYDGDELVAEYNGAGSMLRRYVHGIAVDDPVVWYEGAALADRRFLHSDHQGSIVGVTDINGNTIAINSYDEYGIPSASNLGRFQYTGQAWIPELGMYHYKARVYSPTLGRFLQTDPVGYEDQINLYAYVGNDPANNVDPSGLACERRTGSRICEETATRRILVQDGDENRTYSITYFKRDGRVLRSEWISGGVGESYADPLLVVGAAGGAIAKGLGALIGRAGGRAASRSVATTEGSGGAIAISAATRFTASETAGLRMLFGSGERGAREFLQRAVGGHIGPLPQGVTRSTLERYIIRVIHAGPRTSGAPSQQMRMQGILKILEGM